MLRDDLAEARKQWLSEAKDDPQEYAQRQQSDFVTDANHEGEITDFHSLRHTCGAWLVMTGAQPKVVQQVMRRQSITLTIDTYGHLFPGQEAEAVDQMRQMLVDHQSTPEALRATGTDNHTAEGVQQLGRETPRSAAKECARENAGRTQKKTTKSLHIADLSDDVRDKATHRVSRGGGTRRGAVFYGKITPFPSRWCKVGCSAGRSAVDHRSLAQAERIHQGRHDRDGPDSRKLGSSTDSGLLYPCTSQQH